MERILGEVSKSAGLKKPPSLVIDEGIYTFYAVIRGKIHVGSSLSGFMGEAGVRGLIAHEVYHANHRLRIVLVLEAAMLLSCILSGLMVSALAPTDMLLFLSSSPLAYVLGSLIVLVGASIYFIPSARFVSRRWEYAADRFAVRIVGWRTYFDAMRINNTLHVMYGAIETHSHRLHLPKLSSELLLAHPSDEKRLRHVLRMKHLFPATQCST